MKADPQGLHMPDDDVEDDDWESRANRVYAPTVRYRSLNNSEIDAAMDWRADLGRLDRFHHPRPVWLFLF